MDARNIGRNRNSDAQRMADLILKEAIDNDFGKEKDDMTVMVYKIHKKNI